VLCGRQPAGAIDFWDGRVEVHGFYETRMSFGYEDFNSANKIDMYGWLQVLNLEVESRSRPTAGAPSTWCPPTPRGGEVRLRVESRLRCVRGVDAFGNDAGNLPHRVQNARRQGIAASQLTFDERPTGSAIASV
jgi:hypothetical protein